MHTLLSTRGLIRGAALLTGALGLFGAAQNAQAQTFTPGNLVVSRSVYAGTAGTVTVGQTLPGGGKAVANGAYPNVFNNASVDASFGVTAPIYLDQITPTGTAVNTYAIPTSQLVTSFPSKSELGLNLSTNGQSLTFMGYTSSVNALDISNSFTPGVKDETTNPDTATPTYRAVYQLNADGSSSVTTTNAYSGNNGRNAILDNTSNQYFTVGNAGNGKGSAGVTAGTGVQIVTPGVNATPSTPGTTEVGQFNITQEGFAADKTAKDNNFRGETIFNNTLFVTKGSGGNGINTVYQVGASGTLPTGSGNPITILPGFTTGLAANIDTSTPTSASATNFHPFGLFFANSTTLYVADEGDGTPADAGTAKDPNAGLEKWSFASGKWSLDYTLQAGLNLGTKYTVTGLDTAFDPATDGLRNLTGKVNADGSVSLYGITSTVSGSGDQGADPNKLVAISDILSFTTAGQAANEVFTTLQSAGYGEVLRGVSYAPAAVPEASSSLLLGAGLLGLVSVFFRKHRAAKS